MSQNPINKHHNNNKNAFKLGPYDDKGNNNNNTDVREAKQDNMKKNHEKKNRAMAKKHT